MRTTTQGLVLERMSRLELPLCLYCNRIAGRRWLSFFGVVSRLGDGWFWLATAVALLAAGETTVVFQLLLVGAASYGLYRALKDKTARPRPADLDGAVHFLAAPLDRFSFPSGHTLHAVAFTVVLVAQVPALAWVTVPFTVLVAASRLVLGLHYPSDVLAGGVLGTAVALVSFQL